MVSDMKLKHTAHTSCVALIALCGAAVVVAGCSSVGERAPEQPANGGSSVSPEDIYGPFANIPGQLVRSPQNESEVERIDHNAPTVGACVIVRGESPSAQFDEVPCESSQALYRVVQIAPRGGGSCVEDVDQRLFRGLKDEVSGWTACLDYNWRPDACIKIEGDKATVCDNEATKSRWTLSRVVPNRSDGSLCRPSERAIIHNVRNYTVCIIGKQ
ncbi:LppU/SCO3897 family protein [Tsukamurella tyrosinosolvens]|uniref:LppU/SCO3897 family protein n=1 Tax=Tsukamurella tyrosinosolvens TaxID=57704 RepID=UPI003B75BE4E